jgi:hypothetical protein
MESSCRDTIWKPDSDRRRLNSSSTIGCGESRQTLRCGFAEFLAIVVWRFRLTKLFHRGKEVETNVSHQIRGCTIGRIEREGFRSAKLVQADAKQQKLKQLVDFGRRLVFDFERTRPVSDFSLETLRRKTGLANLIQKRAIADLKHFGGFPAVPVILLQNLQD